MHAGPGRRRRVGRQLPVLAVRDQHGGADGGADRLRRGSALATGTQESFVVYGYCNPYADADLSSTCSSSEANQLGPTGSSYGISGERWF